jgi:hypothetical protein
LAALMEIPFQYKAALELGLLGWVSITLTSFSLGVYLSSDYLLNFFGMMINYSVFNVFCLCSMDKSRATGRAKKMVPRPPPAPYSRPMPPEHFLRNMSTSSIDDEQNQMVTFNKSSKIQNWIIVMNPDFVGYPWYRHQW